MSHRREHESFHEAGLDTMVAPGLCDETSVRFMCRSTLGGAHVLRLRSAASDRDTHELRFEPTEALRRSDHTFSVRYPSHRGDGRALEPGTTHAFELLHCASGARVGHGQFRTAPVPGSLAARRTTFGVVSCHNPFDEHGRPSTNAVRALDVAPEAFHAEDVHRVLLSGDQVYGDLPAPLSLFDADFFREVAPPGRASIFECSPQEVRALYHARYRAFWKTPRFTELQARFACHPILDDHEIIDNFGSAPEHAEKRWANVRAGAIAAFHDYQARRIFGDRPPPSFDHGLRHGDVALYVLDLRTGRRMHDDVLEIVQPAQIERLARFLERNADARATVLLLSVPILPLPDWVVAAAARVVREGHDLMDRWSCEPAQANRDRFIAALAKHARRNPRQRIVLVGGDIHVGAASRFRFDGSSLDCLQLVSSAITNEQSAMARALAHLVPRLKNAYGTKGRFANAAALDGVDGADQNPYAGLNLGVVDITADGDDVGVRLRLMSHDDGAQPRPRTVFDSGEITTASDAQL